MRFRRTIALAATVVGTAVVGLAPAVISDAEAAGGRGGIPFDARALLALSDVDTEAQAYIDDDIGPAIEGTDTLTVLRPGAGGRPQEVGVTNSVWGPPTTIGVTPDGRHAFVLEVKEQRAPGDQSFEEDLPFSTRISVVELGSRPRVVQRTDTGGFAAHSLAVSPRGDYVVVANWAAPGEDSGIPEGQGRQLSVLPFRDGKLGTPQLFGLNNIPGPFVYPNTVAWHPSGNFLAVTIGPRNLVAFYRVSADPVGRLDIQPWGDPVAAGQFPFPGRWTPDGRFFLTASMEWNEPAVSDRNSPPGSLYSVRFDADPAGGVLHGVTRGGTVGINPEGLAISPDGRYVVTVNLRYSHLPEGYDPLRPPTTSSITLAELDRGSGTTRAVGEYTFDGVLPEGVVFDRTGTTLAVAVFDFNGSKKRHGAVQFWRLHAGATPRLEQLPTEVPTVRGTHSLAVAP
jgi:DNA-binding beta-propeller fold protein YncE